MRFPLEKLSIFSFVVDRLTQEENEFLAVPAEIARTLPEKAQQRLAVGKALEPRAPH